MDLNYSISDIAIIVNGEIYAEDQNSEVQSIIFDSRRFVRGENALFVALKTKVGDGHKYINSLINDGVRNFLISDQDFIQSEEANFIYVQDTLLALQNLASHHRQEFHHPIIAIGGSNGKTIIKEWLAQLLSPDFNISRSPKSFNSQLGVALSILQLGSNNDLGIIEAGISKPGEMSRLEKMIQPNIGIFTNIGQAHGENFEDLNQKLNEKIQLFKSCDVIVYCEDHKTIKQKFLSLKPFKDKHLISWSFHHKEVDVYFETLNNEEFRCHYKDAIFSFQIPFKDAASQENIAHVVTTALWLGTDLEKIQKGILNLAPVAMRLELKAAINNCTLINDIYNSDMNSISIAIDFLTQQSLHKSKTLILSDIQESNMEDVELYRQVSEMVRKAEIDTFVGIGKNISKYSKFFGPKAKFFDSTESFIQKFPISQFQNENILLKAARAFKFERIATLLQEKAHQTVMEINLSAMMDNLNLFRSMLQARTKIMVMVKAFSYGSGSFEIANLLRYHHVDYLAVAYVDEGVELRNAGVSLPIMVMNPNANAFDLMLNHSLEPEIYSMELLKELIVFLKQSIHAQQSFIGIHLKMDTGMHRLGFQEDEVDDLIAILQSNPMVRIKSVFSHLVGSDSSQHDDFTKQQIALFQSITQKIKDALKTDFLCHILNSAGIVRFNEYQMDMVRLGIGIYGFGADSKFKKSLRSVSRLKTLITQVRQIHQGETIGYNRSYQAEKEMKIATLPIGYADGFNRKLSNGIGRVLVQGQWRPVVGNVCMDMTMIDVSGMQVKAGDEVIIFEESAQVESIAAAIGTISYEVLTSISRRVKRIYYQE